MGTVLRLVFSQRSGPQIKYHEKELANTKPLLFLFRVSKSIRGGYDREMLDCWHGHGRDGGLKTWHD